MLRLRIQELLRSIRDIHIGVLGDFCLDCYWELDPGEPEVSIETGRPTRAVQLQRSTPGGAGNVATNLVAMGVGEVRAFGVIGGDLFGRELKRLLEERHISLGGLIVQEGEWDTPVYAKPYVGEEEQERIDFGRFNRIAEATEDSILSHVTSAIQNLDALVINQQLVNGICSPRLVAGLNGLARVQNEKVFLLDSRDRRLKFQNMTCKLNATEAARVCGVQADDGSPVPVGKVIEYARRISDRTGKPVFITRSSEGIVAFDASGCWEIQGIRIEQPVDPVGAGDTAVAAIAAALAAGGTVEESAVLANLAAGVTVQKLRQTGTASPEEILQVASDYEIRVRPQSLASESDFKV